VDSAHICVLGNVVVACLLACSKPVTHISNDMMTRLGLATNLDI
jgi:hypothetical protein